MTWFGMAGPLANLQTGVRPAAARASQVLLFQSLATTVIARKRRGAHQQETFKKIVEEFHGVTVGG